MLREIVLILAAMGSLFLIVPLLWIIGGALTFILPLCLFAVVLVYSVFDIKKLYDNEEYKIALYFALFLTLAVVFSFVILYLIFPYVTPKLRI